MKHIYLLTESRYVAQEDADWYVQQILDEDELLSDGLKNHGITTTRVDWADPDVDWSKADAAVFRTIWDYFERYDEFMAWFHETKSKVRFINSPEQILWNIDKHYLLDLKKEHIPIVPSIFIETGERRTLAEICEDSEWDEYILKPCVSGGAFNTFRFRAEGISELEELFSKLIAKESMILQEFHKSIQSRGEVSHMVMGGKYTHSILKKAKGEDFRVQDDFGGTVHAYTASDKEKAFAEKVFAACKELPAYGRVDVMWDEHNRVMVSELEVIEPELWFRNHLPAADSLAEHLAHIL